jgi:RNA polymerase sigma factor (sigma-70 family)
MEKIEESPEQRQWALIHGNLDSLAQLLDLSDPQALALRGHISPEATEVPLADVEPACWKMRALFDEWRTDHDAMTEFTAKAAGAPLQVSRTAMGFMAQMLGYPSPHVKPLSFHALTQEPEWRHPENLALISQLVLDGMLAYKVKQSRTALRAVTGVYASDFFTKRGHATVPYARETGPELLGYGEDALDAYINAVGYHPLLTREQEAALAQRMRLKDSEDPHLRADAALARSTLITHNLRLVLRQAFFTIAPRPYLARGAADIVQEGNVSLIRAIDKFDPAYRTRVATYAIPRIRADIRRWVSKEGFWLVGDDRHHINQARHPENVRPRIRVGLDELPQHSHDRTALAPHEQVEMHLDAEAQWNVIERLETLTPRQRKTLRLMYRKGLSIVKVAEQGGISQQAVSQTHDAALRKIRQHLHPGPNPRQALRSVRTPEVLLEAAGVVVGPGDDPREVAAATIASAGLTGTYASVLALRYGVGLEYPEGMTHRQIQDRLRLGAGMALWYEKRGLKKLRETRDAGQ